MGLKNIKLQGTYDSLVNDVHTEFFNVVLANSQLCRRVGGVFNSRVFASCAEGMQEFIKNDGRMELVLTQSFTPKDADAIYKKDTKLEQQIIKNWITNLDQIKDKFVENHTRALAWLLKNELLEIRIMVPYDQQGRPIDEQTIDKISEFKRKIGVFRGQNGDEWISFSGSVDFDDPVQGDAYHFDVYRYWDNSERKWVNNHNEEFKRCWSEETKTVNKHVIKTIKLPMAIHEHLIKKSPQTKDEINLKYYQLRPYQKTAIERWLLNNGRGVLEMATGTGKTRTGINATLRLAKQLNGGIIVVVVTPYNTIAEQWKAQLKFLNISTIRTNERNWKQLAGDSIRLLNAKKQNSVQAIVTSYSIYSTAQFKKIIQSCRVPTMLIADEVHHAGAITLQNGLMQEYQYRLGLTATLNRYYDKSGTNILTDYFGGIVFKYELGQAIREGFLVPYKYFLHRVELTDKEYEQYMKETQTIGMLSSKNDDEKDREKLELAILKRARIIKDAANKIPMFKQIIDSMENIKHTLIYCSGNQIKAVQEILSQTNPPTVSKKITAKEPKLQKDRLKIIQEFTNENYGVIVAINVLDEGMDVPKIKNCILLSSDGNPKQFIQRRGRVLRKYSGKYADGSKKSFATIHDIIITPRTRQTLSARSKKIEAKILRSQLERQTEIARSAINSDDCLSVVKHQEQMIAWAE